MRLFVLDIAFSSAFTVELLWQVRAEHAHVPASTRKRRRRRRRRRRKCLLTDLQVRGTVNSAMMKRTALFACALYRHCPDDRAVSPITYWVALIRRRGGWGSATLE